MIRLIPLAVPGTPELNFTHRADMEAALENLLQKRPNLRQTLKGKINCPTVFHNWYVLFHSRWIKVVDREEIRLCVGHVAPLLLRKFVRGEIQCGRDATFRRPRRPSIRQRTPPPRRRGGSRFIFFVSILLRHFWFCVCVNRSNKHKYFLGDIIQYMLGIFTYFTPVFRSGGIEINQ